MKKILGIGNALVDIILFLENDDLLTTFSLPKGSMQLVDIKKSSQIEKATQSLKKHMASGGSAANTIHGLAKLGLETAFIGTIGKDSLGQFFEKDLINSKIKPFLSYGSSNTGRAISLVSKDGERTFATYLGAAIELAADQTDIRDFNKYDHLHLEGYLIPNQQLVEKVFKSASQYNMSISLDLASYNVVEANLGFLKHIIRIYNPIVFANEQEARAFTSKDDPYKALDILSNHCDVAIVKTGSKGSLIYDHGKKLEVEAIKVNCIDTTGAGDLYAGGYLYGFVNGLASDKCGKIGSLLAGKVIEEAGAKISETSWEYIRKSIVEIKTQNPI